LKKIREEKSVGLEELAKKIDVPVGCLKEVEQGKRHIDRDLVVKIADVLEVPQDYFPIDERTNFEKQVNQDERLSGSVGKKIRKLREERGLTLVDLGRKAGVSYTHISEIERGNTCPSLKTIDKLANVLELPVTFFFSEESTEGGEFQTGGKSTAAAESHNLASILAGKSVWEAEFIGKLLDLIRQYKRDEHVSPDPVTGEIINLVKGLSDHNKKHLLEYAKFLRSKEIEPVNSE
jgi:transcriptional regulator with XRE-family HTH domain